MNDMKQRVGAAQVSPPAHLYSTLQIAEVSKPTDSDDELYLETASGGLVHIHAAARTATLTKANGAVYNIVDTAAGNAGNNKVGADGFFSALMTSGSFTMMQAGSF